jgi:hypothetical protein
LDDLNDNNPEFPKPELSLTIPESSEVGYVLFISTATDPDSGVNNGVATLKRRAHVFPVDYFRRLELAYFRIN